ncbi:hypothetical protein KRP22_013485 [Phytophthora ramorum]|nr:hypothetical protein KRP22_11346 [Phytophthora ramorum]
MRLLKFFADVAVLSHKEKNESEALSIRWTALRTKKSMATLSGQVDRARGSFAPSTVLGVRVHPLITTTP